MRLRPLISAWRACAATPAGVYTGCAYWNVADDPLRVDRGGAVEGHAELAVGLQRLQAVHVVGDRAASRLARRRGGSSSSPTRAGGAAAASDRCAAPPRWAGRESRRAARARARWGRASSASAWSECVAITTASKRSGSHPCDDTTTWSGWRVDLRSPASRAGDAQRTAASAPRRTRRDPPVTVRQRGRPRKPSIPWLSKNSTRKRAGKDHI